MNFPNYAEIQQIPNPNSEFSVLHDPNLSVGYPQNNVYDPYQQSNVDPHGALYPPPQPRPPGVDPPYLAPAPATVSYVQQPPGFEVQHGADAPAVAVAAPAAYYQEPNVSWLAAMPQYGATPYTSGVISIPNPATKPQTRQTWKKGPKQGKIVQPAWCEVCKVDCNSKDMLDNHNLGKKHLKNLKKLAAPTPTAFAAAITTPVTVTFPPASVALAPVPPSASTNQPIIGPQENPEIPKPKSQNWRKKAAARYNDLDAKRRKVLEGGAAADSVRQCVICKVVCNSDTVFNYHLRGQKHASMLKMHALGV